MAGTQARRFQKLKLAAGTSLIWACLPGATYAQTAIGNLGVQITITGGCVLNTITNINFGTRSVLNANVDSDGAVEILCTTGVPFFITLGAGGATGATVANRRMISGSGDTIGYQLYQDSARATIWGMTENVNALAGTGTGSAQTIPIRGRVPPQTTPPAGIYTDTVTVTVNY